MPQVSLVQRAESRGMAVDLRTGPDLAYTTDTANSIHPGEGGAIGTSGRSARTALLEVGLREGTALGKGDWGTPTKTYGGVDALEALEPPSGVACGVRSRAARAVGGDLGLFGAAATGTLGRPAEGGGRDTTLRIPITHPRVAKEVSTASRKIQSAHAVWTQKHGAGGGERGAGVEAEVPVSVPRAPAFPHASLESPPLSVQ